MSKKPYKKKGPQREKPEFDQEIIDLARVTRVTKGGKQLSFRACLVLGDRKGKVGYGLAKGKDVQIAVEKAVRQAKKTMIKVAVLKETIPHVVKSKFKAARVLLKPAPKGSGIIAGSSVRTVLELAGVPNVSAKVLCKTKNKISIVKAVFKALESFKEEAVERAEKENTKTTSAPKANLVNKNPNKKFNKPAFKKPFDKQKKEEVKKPADAKSSGEVK